MSRRISLSFAFSLLLFAVSLCLLATSAMYNPRTRSVPDPSPRVPVTLSDIPEEATDRPTEEEPFHTRVIRLYRGKIAVFAEGSDTPEQILPADPSNLPPDALERLREGIPAVTAEQYRNYLDDFS